MSRRYDTQAKLNDLVSLLKGKDALLIVLQDHPDPDALASAMALRALANSVDVQCSLTCRGTIGRAENRALVRYAALNIRAMEEVDVERHDLIALVDTQPGQRNNSLPDQIVPDIVIDHHPMHPESRSVAFTDIRSHYGATSTMLFEYLQAASQEPETPLATALLYGIRSDTHDFERPAKQADIDASTALYELANKRMLGAIQRGSVPLAYFQVLATALANARRCRKSIYSGLGSADNADMVAEVADLLLRYEDAEWSLCWAHVDQAVRLSVRTFSAEKPADQIARHIVRRKGSAGGHPTMAAGQITCQSSGKADRARLDRLIRTRFLRITGGPAAACRRIT